MDKEENKEQSNAADIPAEEKTAAPAKKCSGDFRMFLIALLTSVIVVLVYHCIVTWCDYTSACQADKPQNINLYHHIGTPGNPECQAAPECHKPEISRHHGRQFRKDGKQFRKDGKQFRRDGRQFRRGQNRRGGDKPQSPTPEQVD